ncbi:MAG TPA: methyl-accepting chemotaxis protein [Longimicrobiales bacterium]
MAIFGLVFVGAGSGILVLASRAALERRAAERLISTEMPGLGLVLNIDRDAYQGTQGLTQAALASDSAQRRRWLAFYEENRGQMQERMAQYARLPELDSVGAARAQAALAARDSLLAMGDVLRERVRAGAAPAALAPLLAAYDARLDTLHARLGDAEEAHNKQAAALSDEVRAAATMFIWLVWVGLAVFFLVGILVSWFLTREFTSPIQRLARLSERIAQGDLTVTAVGLRRGDEIGRLGASFDRMVPYLRELLTRVQFLSGELAQSSSSISGTARDTASSLSQLNVAIDQITHGAQEQAQAAQETAEVVVDMSGSIQRVAGGAAQIASGAGDAVEVARRGGETVQRAMSSMEEVRAAVGDAAALVREMGDRTQRIGQIVEVISQIAGRTNLLALNAAIEAARAGEHGRGFAVVADEVRKLADGSQKSAAEIARLILGIEEGTRRAVEAMEAGVGRVEREAVVAREAMGALGEILSAVEATGTRVGTISQDATLLAERAERVSALVQDVASIAQESAASAEEMSAQSLQVAAAMATIAPPDETGVSDQSATAALRRMAAELQEATAAFQV